MRTLRVGAAGFLIAILVVAAAAVAAIWRTLPPRTAIDAIPGLAATVSVTFDADGVPRIRAANLGDASAALGYVHARDRLAQMDLMRRAAAGELSELVGRRALALDEYARVLGTRDAAERAVAELPPETRALLDAYARGVNAFIARHGRFAAPEYLLLGTPRAWTPVDSMLWAETMGLYLSGNLRTELERLVLARQLDRARILRLWPVAGAASRAASLGAPPPSPDGAALASATLAAIPRFPAPLTLPQTASNGWAVDAAHSTTGAPLLAGDPHLAYALPCLWYLARIDTPAAPLAGATAPGVPFLVIGRNRRIAWTFTTAAADTEDVFIERVLDRDHYLGPDGPLPFGHRAERIRVRGKPDVLLDVRLTRHGPVLSDLRGDFGGPAPPAPDLVLAASVASLQADNRAAFGLSRLNGARDVAEAGDAAASITAPVQNLIVADPHAIALFTTGRVPVRRAGDGAFAVPGWDGAHDWTGWASGAALPRVVAPPTGMVVNANEPVAGAPSVDQDAAKTAWMGRDAPGSWRARRIRALLAAASRFSLDDFAAMQGDVRDLQLAALLPRLLGGAVAHDELSSFALRALADWDATMAPDRPEPLIAATWLRGVDAAVMEAAGDPDEAAARPGDVVLDALARGDAGLCGGPCSALLSTTLGRTVGAIAAEQGNNPTGWQWGRVHRARFHNPLWGALPLPQAELAVGGDAETIDAQGAAGASFAAVHGASFRGVYDLGDLDASRFVIATGESGNPFSGHLLDWTSRWQQVRTRTLGIDAQGVSATLELRGGSAPSASAGIAR